jgi:hypothetical protein
MKVSLNEMKTLKYDENNICSFSKKLLNHFICFNLLGFSSFQKIDNHFEKTT